MGKANRNLKWTREPAAEGVEGTKVSGKTFNFTTSYAVGFPQMQYVRTFEFWTFFCNRIFSYLMKLCFRFFNQMWYPLSSGGAPQRDPHFLFFIDESKTYGDD